MHGETGHRKGRWGWQAWGSGATVNRVDREHLTKKVSVQRPGII